MKIAYLFSGQGAQYPGMGADLYENSPAAAKVFDEAGDAVKEMCFSGTKEELGLTKNTQPCVYTMDYACCKAFEEKIAEKGVSMSASSGDGEPAEANRPLLSPVYAGFSLGEYAALAAAGAFSGNGSVSEDSNCSGSINDDAADCSTKPDIDEGFKNGLSVIRDRASFMSEACRDSEGNKTGGMAAAIGSPEKILECVDLSRENEILEGANFNSDKQIVVSGTPSAVKRFCERSADYRLRVVELDVEGAFHSPVMEPVSERLHRSVSAACEAVGKNKNIGKMKSAGETENAGTAKSGGEIESAGTAKSGGEIENAGKIWMNTTARPLSEFEGSLADICSLQVMKPVKWCDTVKNLIADDVNVFIEFGPGKTLSGLVKKIDKNAVVFNVENMETLESTVSSVAELLAKN